MSVDLPRRRSDRYASLPPAPPLPAGRGSTQHAKARLSILDRIFGGRKQPPKPHPLTPQQIRGQLLYTPNFGHVPSQTTSCRTGLRLRALDINEGRTHVVLAGGRILKTLKVDGVECIDDVDVREATSAVPRHLASSITQLREGSSHSAAQQAPDIVALQHETFDIEDVAWSNGRWAHQIATAAASGKVNLYDLERPGVQIGRLYEHSRQVHKVDFSPVEGQLLLSASQDGTVRLWDVRSLRHVMKFNGRSDAVRHTKWSPVSSVTFALGTDNGAVQRWDVRQNRMPVLKFFAHNKLCNSIDWHPDGRHLASGGASKDIKVWDMTGDRKQEPLVTLRTPFPIQNIRWRPPCYLTTGSNRLTKQCSHLATSYKTNAVVHVWDLRRPFIPFKEYHHFLNEGTTDLLWRSQDLLWSVGLEGEFTQSDIRYLPRVMDRRPPSVFSLSPQGDLIFFSQKRKRPPTYVSNTTVEEARAVPEVQPRQLFSSSAEERRQDGSDSSSGGKFLSSSLTGRGIPGRASAKTDTLFRSTPPNYKDFGKPVTELDETMRRAKASHSVQAAHTGTFPESALDARFRVGVRNSQSIKFGVVPTVGAFRKELRDLLSHYSKSACRMDDYETAQVFDFFCDLISSESCEAQDPYQMTSSVPDKTFDGQDRHSGSQPSLDNVVAKEEDRFDGRSQSPVHQMQITKALPVTSATKPPLEAATPNPAKPMTGPPTPTLDLALGELNVDVGESRQLLKTLQQFTDTTNETQQTSNKEENAVWPQSLDREPFQFALEDDRATSEPLATAAPASLPMEKASNLSSQTDSSEDTAVSMNSSFSARMPSAYGSFASGIVRNPGQSVSEYIHAETPEAGQRVTQPRSPDPAQTSASAPEFKTVSEPSPAGEDHIALQQRLPSPPPIQDLAEPPPHISQPDLARPVEHWTRLIEPESTHPLFGEAGSPRLRDLFDSLISAGEAAIAANFFLDLLMLLQKFGKESLPRRGDPVISYERQQQHDTLKLMDALGVSEPKLTSLFHYVHEQLLAALLDMKAAELRWRVSVALPDVFAPEITEKAFSILGCVVCGSPAPPEGKCLGCGEGCDEVSESEEEEAVEEIEAVKALGTRLREW
ncbi:MAG: hypothetical protein Q9162_003424 [Coniocarpon cinnabarinum]